MEVERHSIPNQEWLTLIGISITLYIIHLAVIIPLYNITSHPLAHYPGPHLFGAYHFPYYWYLVRGTLMHKIKTLHAIYGDTVRVRPDELSYTAPQAWKDIYGFRQGKGQLPKAYGYGDETPTNNIIFAADKDHSRMRKLLAHAFSEKAMHEQEPLIMSYVDLLIKRLGESIDGAAAGKVDMMTWYNSYNHLDTTFDIVGDLAFGQSFNCLESGNMHYWITTIFFAIHSSVYLQVLVRYPLLHKLVKLFPSAQGEQMRRKLDGYAKETAEKRLATETDRKDFMWYIRRYNDEKGMSNEEIAANSGLLIVAGSETTATLLSGATYYLLKNRHVQEKLTNEIRSAYKSEKEITLLSVAKLEYLQAVLEEAFRMYPPVPIGLIRRVKDHSDIINGKVVPANTSVAVTQLAAYQNASNFTSPDTFAPERWLDNPDPRFANDCRDVLQPFSIGPRNCLGRNLAYAEMRSILAKILYNFDMELDAPSENWTYQTIRSLWQKPALNVKLKRRTEA